MPHPLFSQFGAGSYALVLTGGGARCAYQVGVLSGLSDILKSMGSTPEFPFSILQGTSAGALNATFLASKAQSGLQAFDSLAQFWSGIHCQQVYQAQSWEHWLGDFNPKRAWHWMRSLVQPALPNTPLKMNRGKNKGFSAFLDNTPLVSTLHQWISLPQIDHALQQGILHGLAVTASSYSSGLHWTFCHTADNANQQAWRGDGRRASFEPITIEHLLASSAIPFVFPVTPLWVDDRVEYFGDGMMGQHHPLSPSVHLGASHVLVIGVNEADISPSSGEPVAPPSMADMASHAIFSLMQDAMQSDLELSRKMDGQLANIPQELRRELGLQPLRLLEIRPSQSINAIAKAHMAELPLITRQLLSGMGAWKNNAAALASFLLFESDFARALIDLGRQDALEKKLEILAFLKPKVDVAVQ